MTRKLTMTLLVGVVLAQTGTSAFAAPASTPGVATVSAVQISPTDASKVPHYFGPYPNWANSPQVLADAVVTISNGGGAGAEATAAVDPKTGGITSITVTNSGSGYTSAPDVAITAAGVTPTPASATAVISLGVIKSIAVDETGFGFTAPAVTFTGGNPTPGLEATAVASGGVDNLIISDGGSGYTIQPIVEFSLPDLPTVRSAPHANALPGPSALGDPPGRQRS